MLFQILKKDMMKRKGVNAILFLFITLATIFLSSSVNNIMIVSSAVDYYMDYANIPDTNVVLNSEKYNAEINAWLNTQKEEGLVTTYDYSTFRMLPNKALAQVDGDEKKSIDSNGASLYICAMDVDYNKVYDQQGESFALASGEVAMSTSLMNRNKLKEGDNLILSVDDKERSFKVTVEMKDAAYGNEMVGMSRIVMNEDDYKEVGEHFTTLGLYYIMSPDEVTFSKKLDDQGFPSIFNAVSKSMYKMVYSFDMIIAGLLILIGVCLILIAMLVLRFTLVFTMEEQYQEIGILKAIGLRDFQIKKLYLIKYLAIVSVGACLGLFISIPVSNFMIASVSENMIMASGDINIGINLLCAAFIIIMVLSFCYFCTRKLNKVSAIAAIHGGSKGESFHERPGLSLAKRLHMPVFLYLGLNDIFVHIRRYAVLIITFCLSCILMTIPLNTLNTMTSSEMVTKFMLNPDSSVFVREIESKDEGQYLSVDDLQKGITRLQKEMKEKGYEAEFTSDLIFFLKFREDENAMSRKAMSVQVMGKENDFAQYSQGEAPKLINEIAFSKSIMEEEGWGVGDYVETTINGKEQRMLITGSYTDYMQLGMSARLNPLVDTSEEIMFDYWSVMVHLDSDLSQEELAKKLSVDFPNYEWLTGQELVNQNVGGIQDILGQLVVPMTSMLCLVIMLITLLMEKLFITREKGEIAMMKSVGFRYRSICNWQVGRMTLVVLASFLILVPLSLLSNQYLLKPIFAIMGAEVDIQIDFLQVYVVYPGILLAGVMIATLLAVHGVKRVDIREMNNLE